MSVKSVQKDLRSYATSQRATTSSWFFKTGTGQYGEGDIFIGVTVPDIRKVARTYAKALTLSETEILLKSKIHEERLVAILMLVEKYQTGDAKTKKAIYDFYLKNAPYVNNWDLVDASAHYIVGDYLLHRNWKILEKLARSKNLWEKRIAMVATFAFIQNRQSEPTFKIATLLMKDNHDLIHKASGWMLREVGKRISENELCGFLDLYAIHMPRTTLRYAIERFSEAKRKEYLNRKSQ